jgi:CheY-like chemotaxis protein/two-component sensor histidine kinase
MSHELRTPLNGIIGFSELLYDGRIGPVPDRQKELLGRILKSSKHLLRLINEILDLSRIESGRLDLRPETVSLAGLVHEVAAILSSLAAEKRIRIETRVDPEIDSVVTDPSRLKQILYNYLSNALKFTAEGGKVSVSIRPETAADFRLEVSDTGVGIASTDLSRLFTEFQQLDSGPAKRFQGTGLGLALTRRIVEAQGGSVGVRSTPGRGSTFWAILPRSNAPPEAVAPHILIVEDEPAETRALTQYFQETGCAVETAPSGAAAVAAATERAFHAIALDLLLPDAPGWEVLAAIRTTDHNRRTPVIVLSIVEESQVDVELRGPHAFLKKPVRREDIWSALDRLGIAAPAGRA